MDILRRNNVQVSGRETGQPMVFAHGFGCDQNMWRFVTPAFEDEYRIVLFDHVGAGRSDLSAYNRARYGSLQGYASDVLDICRELDLSRVVFVGLQHEIDAAGFNEFVGKPISPDILLGKMKRYLSRRA